MALLRRVPLPRRIIRTVPVILAIAALSSLSLIDRFKKPSTLQQTSVAFRSGNYFFGERPFSRKFALLEVRIVSHALLPHARTYDI